MSNSKRKLRDWIEGYTNYTANSEAPLSYRLWVAISCVAAVLQRKCRVEWGTGLTWYPNMYVVLVGPSAARKGTAMNPGLELLQSISNVKIAANATSLQALIKRLKETNHNDPDLRTGDMIFHSSLTIFSKEFTVFLGYKNNDLISALCDWYDCDNYWSYETISRNLEEVIGVWVNLIGATTPDLIRLCMPIEMIGGGLTSRIIFVVEDRKAQSCPLPLITKEELELREALLHDLEKISLTAGRYEYSREFIEHWVRWYEQNDANPPDMGKNFEGYLGRRATHVMKLSMILAASRGSNLYMDLGDLERAIQILEATEYKMRYVFKGLGKNPYADVMQQALTWMLSSGRSEIPIREFYDRYIDDLDRLSLDRMLEALEAIGKIKRVIKDGHTMLLICST